MIGKIFGVLCMAGLIGGILCGRTAEVSAAALEGSTRAVRLTIELVGMMGLWSGIMRVMDKAGVTKFIAKLLSPIIKILFGDAWKKQNGVNEIAAAITANMLGMGNAATPLTLKAMEKLKENSNGTEGSGDMTVFAVMSCFPFTLLPATLITLRTAAGAAEPADILVPVWLVSLMSCVFACAAAKLMSCVRSGKRRK